MIIINANKHKENITDYPQRCANCGRLIYIPGNSNGVWAKCPYCDHKQ